MKKNYYKMFPELKFGFVRFQSEILFLEEAKRINFEYKSHINYSKIQALLIIIENDCKPNFSVEELEILAHLYNNEPQINNHKIIVWLVSAPLITAFTHLFVSQIYDNSLYCSTPIRAYELLNIPIKFEEFISLIY